MRTLWNTIIYQPLLNTLIFLASVLPGKSLGLAIIALTVLVRIILLPLSKKSIKSQYALRALDPKIQAIKARKLEKQAEAQELFLLYKREKVNPFSGCLLLLIQLPILIALYQVFMNGLNAPELFYSFVNAEGINQTFFGLNITLPSMILALLAAITQAVQAFLMPKPVASQSSDPNSFQGQLMKSMSIQTRYVLPVLIFFIARKLSAAVSLYWIVTNLFSIGQELYFKRLYAKKSTTVV